MKKHFWDQLINADLFPSPELFVDENPPADQDSGGLDNEDDDSSIGDELGAAGKDTLVKERQARKETARKLAQAEEKLRLLSEKVDPEVYKEAVNQAEQLRATLEAKERDTREATRRIQEKASLEVQQAKQLAETERQKRISLETRTQALNTFRLCKGLDETDPELGITSFDAWWDVHGSKFMKLDEKTGRLAVYDRDGDPITGEDGQPVDPAKWLDAVADKSPTVAQYFKSKAPEGSGGIQGTRNSRTVQSRSLEQLRAASPQSLLNSHYGNK